MKVTVLIENTSNNALICEHGLSFLIEYKDKTILLDTGSSDKFYENAGCLGISFDNLSAAVLSHAHYDHSGGFQKLFENHKDVKVYAQKNVFEEYASASGGMHEIGIPKVLHEYKERFLLIDGVTEIFKNIYLVPHSAEGLEKIGAKTKLYKKERDELIPDDFSHEQSLVFDTNKGLVIFNSCSHGGVDNIICEAKAACGNKKVCAYLGGFHMKGKVHGQEVCTFSDEEINELCSVINEEKIEFVYTGHCTGIQGFHELKKRLGDTVQNLTTGLRIEWKDTNYNIREIEEKDNEKIESVIRTCLIEFGGNHEGTAWTDPNLGRFSYIYNSVGNKYWVAEDECGKIVGGVGIGELEGAENVCELQKMYCLQEARGTGIAHELIKIALDYAKEHYSQCYLETLENMVAAQKFYEKYDFYRVKSPLVQTGHFACDVCYLKEL